MLVGVARVLIAARVFVAPHDLNHPEHEQHGGGEQQPQVQRVAERQRAEVRLAADRADDRRQDVGGERRHDVTVTSPGLPESDDEVAFLFVHAVQRPDRARPRWLVPG